MSAPDNGEEIETVELAVSINVTSYKRCGIPVDAEEIARDVWIAIEHRGHECIGCEVTSD